MRKFFLIILSCAVLLLPFSRTVYADENICKASPNIKAQKLGRTTEKKDVIAESTLYAIFSAISYNDEGLGNYRIPSEWHHAGSRSHKSGLFIATFENEKKKQLVIAFRGTEGKSFRDWAHNLLPLLKAQSSPAFMLTQELISLHPNWQIILTGHSLGGGLALELSHRIQQVSAVTFNPSPRIGFERLGYSNKRIVVREKHEPLALVRFDREKWQLAYDVLVDFTPGFFGVNSFTQHGIDGMAINLLTLSSVWSPESASLKKSICGV